MEFIEESGPIPPEYHRFFGSRTGLVTGLSLTPPGRGEPQAYVSAANGPKLHVLRDGLESDPGLRTGGKAVDPDDVLVRGIGETCERYAQHFPDPSRIETGTYEERAREGRVVPFEYLTVWKRANGEENVESDPRPGDGSDPRPGDGSDPRPGDGSVLPPLSRDTTMPWTAGVDLLTGESVSVPAELVWSGVGGLVDLPPRFVDTSSGCAAGECIEDALLGGLTEVIERDGFMRTWLIRETPPAVDLGQFPTLGRFLGEFLPDRNQSVHLFQFDTAVDVPAVGAALLDDLDRRPAFVTGGSAGIDIEAAALDALAETAQSWQYVKSLHAFEDPEIPSVEDQIMNLDDNVLLYAEPENFEHVSFLTEGKPARIDTVAPPGSTKETLKAVLESLDEADCTPIAVDITPPDIGEVGVSVVNVFVPELLPLSLPALPPSEHPSLSGVDVTSLPHPYP